MCFCLSMCAESLTGKLHSCRNCIVVRLIRPDNQDDRYTDRLPECKDRHCIGTVLLSTRLYVQSVCVYVKINYSSKTHVAYLCLTVIQNSV